MLPGAYDFRICTLRTARSLTSRNMSAAPPARTLMLIHYFGSCRVSQESGGRKGAKTGADWSIGPPSTRRSFAIIALVKKLIQSLLRPLGLRLTSLNSAPRQEFGAA